ncbi:MAG TPA: glycosyl hydrolase, partial [Saprospiraceae bacterium]|nr:glycosyl hydrolase [Saprospiraceae bacterium]
MQCKHFIVIGLIIIASTATFAQKKKSKTTNAPIPIVQEETKIDYNTVLQPLKWRNIGPFRGGRSVTACGVIGDISTYYMGKTGGGVWKTQDMGITWHNISDGYMKTGSVGAIAVAPSDPNVVYVGMGEHAPRGVMTHHGDGVYKSTDAGKSWKHLGLEKTQHISRVIIHPTNPDIVYIAVQGALYSPSEERGIYMTNDGGKNWKNVLYVDSKTGCSELSMDANNHRILYATMWEHGREPWKVTSGGPGSGVYKSTDAGETWQKIQNGLPEGLGKMAIAVAASNSDKVYLLVEADREKEEAGLYVSDNGGDSWDKVTVDQRLVQRSWYYMELFIDPKNEHTIYVLSAPALKSIDGGKTW